MHIILDAIHYNVREDGSVRKKAADIIIGLNLEGRKDILGIWLGATESSKYWLGVLNGLKNRGVKDILIASCRWPERICRSNQHSVSRYRSAALRNPPDTQFHEVRIL